VTSLADLIAHPSFAAAAVLEFAAGAGETPALPAHPPADPWAALRFSYRPVWNTSNRLITTYLCSVEALESNGAGPYADARQVLGTDPAAMARLDELLIERVVGDLNRLIAEGRQLLLTLPVHFDTVGSQAFRRRCVDRLSALPEAARKYLIVEIIDLPDGVPQSRLFDLAAPLRQVCRSVIGRMSLAATDMSALHGARIAAAGCDVSSFTASGLSLMHCLGRFQRLAEKAGLTSYVRGVGAPSIVMAALGAGFAFMDGDAIAKRLAEPQSILSLDLIDIYRELMAPLGGAPGPAS
jgi:hypothetical protein